MISSILHMDLGDIYNASLSDPEFAKEVQDFYDSNPHNNGWFTYIQIEEHGKYCPLMIEYLISQGAKYGDIIMLTSSW